MFDKSACAPRRRRHALRHVLLAFLACASLATPAFCGNGSVTYTYDALGRVLSASYDTGVIINYSYDANGNRTQQVVNVNTGKMCWDTITACSGGATSTWDTGLWDN
jgi:YD repeat-containing protein